MRRIVVIFMLLVGLAAGAFAQAGHYVALSWTPSIDGASNPTLAYNIYRGTAAGGESATPVNSSPVAAGCTAAAGNCTFTDSNVLAGQKYFYRMTAILAGSESAYSNEVSATIPLAGPTAVACSAK